MKTLLIVLAACILIYLSYPAKRIIDITTVHTIVKTSLSYPEKERLSFILNKLKEVYPINKTPIFRTFNGGGACALVSVLYASLGEYLIVYGSPSATSANSGRYLMDVYDIIYRGKIMSILPDNPEGIITSAGNYTHLAKGSAHNYSMTPNTWMIEYSHGITISGFPYLLLSMFISGDPISPLLIMYDHAKAMISNLFLKLPSKEK